MENASKALLIAGGILILIILVSLILIVRNNVTNFYASQDELQMTTDRAKFNEQFTRYNRDDVEGYELISLVNKVIDYNERVSSASAEGNSEQAEPIYIKIALSSQDEIDNKIAYDKDIGSFLIKKGNLVIKGNNNTPINKNTEVSLIEIFKDMKEIQNSGRYTGGLTKQIENIILSSAKLNRCLVYDTTNKSWMWNKGWNSLSAEDKESDINEIKKAISKYYGITGDDQFNLTEEILNSNTPYTNVSKKYWYMINKIGIKLYKYYEYIQFTKAKFKCTKMDYSSTTGRVTNLEFFFTGEIE